MARRHQRASSLPPMTSSLLEPRDDSIKQRRRLRMLESRKNPRMLSLSEAERRPPAIKPGRPPLVEAVSHRQLPLFPPNDLSRAPQRILDLHVGKRLAGCIGVLRRNEPL